MNKKEIRAEVGNKKKQMEEPEIIELSKILSDRFCNTEQFARADVLYAYMSYNQEVRTSGIIENAWKAGKRVAVPKTYDKSYMEFCYISSFDELSDGYCHIPEPVTDKIANEKEALILMPGLAFDRQMNRIGYGGGFYDKYLSLHPETKFTKIALGFDFQLYDRLEVEAHDEKMDMIITPTKIIE